MELKCNGKVLANRIYVPESVKEKSKGAYGLDLSNGNAMMFMRDSEGTDVYDMMWMKHDVGYIALDRNRRISKVGIMKKAFLGVLGGIYPVKKCNYFIELNPDKVKGLNVGDEVTWGCLDKIE